MGHRNTLLWSGAVTIVNDQISSYLASCYALFKLHLSSFTDCSNPILTVSQVSVHILQQNTHERKKGDSEICSS